MDILIILLIASVIFNKIKEKKKREEAKNSREDQGVKTYTPTKKSIFTSMQDAIKEFETSLETGQSKANNPVSIPQPVAEPQVEPIVGCFEKSNTDFGKSRIEGDTFFEEHFTENQRKESHAYDFSYDEESENALLGLDDLRRSIIMSEVLAKPKALRR